MKYSIRWAERNRATSHWLEILAEALKLAVIAGMAWVVIKALF